jgi:hypothetical protein
LVFLGGGSAGSWLRAVLLKWGKRIDKRAGGSKGHHDYLWLRMLQWLSTCVNAKNRIYII